MKYASDQEMQYAHYHDIIDTVGPMYEQVVMSALGGFLTVMITAHERDLVKVREDLIKLTQHALSNIDALIAAGSAKRVLH